MIAPKRIPPHYEHIFKITNLHPRINSTRDDFTESWNNEETYPNAQGAPGIDKVEVHTAF
ncbi:hypothetical protein G3O00_21010 [Burkholderia sp. Ac-20384]|uniref:hypothetical protein n=1 Tax=Burkholderia sp. Ac-20384 TaxID=2703902 RepID=UPI0019800960|nr:hypothetical protein [Burkholderia sp. Ac-20384]MBN3826091.1 hypothetical protein [Burkholderia sp. Ac-20384]